MSVKAILGSALVVGFADAAQSLDCITSVLFPEMLAASGA